MNKTRTIIVGLLAVATFLLTACQTTPLAERRGGISHTFEARLDETRQAAVSALANRGFEVKKEEPNYIEAIRPRTHWSLKPSGGETVGVRLNSVSSASTQVKVNTNRTFVGLAGQRDWAWPILFEMIKTFASRTQPSRGEEGSGGKLDEIAAKDANIDEPYGDGTTMLMIASGMKTPEIVSFLIRQRADVNAVDQNGMTALHYALAAGNVSNTQALLAAGADINVTVKLTFGFLPRVSFSEALFNEKSPTQVTTDANLLMYAAMSPTIKTDSLNFLLGHGFDVNTRNADNYSALTFAVLNFRPEAAAFLMNAGADPWARDKNGNSLWDLAQGAFRLRSQKDSNPIFLYSPPPEFIRSGSMGTAVGYAAAMGVVEGLAGLFDTSREFPLRSIACALGTGKIEKQIASRVTSLDLQSVILAVCSENKTLDRLYPVQRIPPDNLAVLRKSLEIPKDVEVIACWSDQFSSDLGKYGIALCNNGLYRRPVWQSARPLMSWSDFRKCEIRFIPEAANIDLGKDCSFVDIEGELRLFLGQLKSAVAMVP